MKRTLQLAFACIIFSHLGAQVTFEKKIYDPFIAHYRDQVVLSDSSIVLIGYSDHIHSIIVRLDQYGDTIWTRKFSAHYSMGATESHDGAIVVAGVTIAADNSHCLTKISRSGQVLWHKLFSSGSTVDASVKVTSTSAKGFIVNSAEQLPGNPLYSTALHKFDSVGNLIWTLNLKLDKDNFSYSNVELPNGDVMVCGSYGASGTSLLMFKVNSAGVPIWAKTYKHKTYSIGLSIVQNVNGSLSVCGSHGFTQGLLLVTDTAGSPILTTAYGTPAKNVFFAKVVSLPNGFLLAGTSYTNSNNEGLLMRTDLSGNIQFTRGYGFGYLNSVAGIAQRPGGGYVISGENSEMSKGTGLYVAAVDTLGKTSCSLQTIPITSSVVTLTVAALSFTAHTTSTIVSGALTRSSVATTFTAICATCIPPPSPVNSTPGNKLFVCTPGATTLSATGTGTLQWYFTSTGGSPFVAGPSFGTPTMSVGQYSYYVASKTCAESLVRTAITITVVNCVGVEESQISESVSLMPNPAEDRCTVSFNGQVPDEVALFSAEGRIVNTWWPETAQLVINTGDLGQGIYFIRITKGPESAVKKLVIIK